jgi:hypothetical protein
MLSNFAFKISLESTTLAKSTLSKATSADSEVYVAASVLI